MTKPIKTPYVIPRKEYGYTLKQAPYKLETNFMEALRRLSVEKTARHGRLIAPATLIFNIMLSNRELKHHYNQVLLDKKESSNDQDIKRIKKEFH